jgi:hypothetical protein
LQKVTKLNHVGIEEHGDSIMTEIETEAGSISLLFEPTMLETAISDLIAALVKSQARKNQSMMGVVSAAEPRRSRVALDQTGETVLLSFQMPSGLEHHFALPKREAAGIGHKIQQAAKTQRPAKKPHAH